MSSQNWLRIPPDSSAETSTMSTKSKKTSKGRNSPPKPKTPDRSSISSPEQPIVDDVTILKNPESTGKLIETPPKVDTESLTISQTVDGLAAIGLAAMWTTRLIDDKSVFASEESEIQFSQSTNDDADTTQDQDTDTSVSRTLGSKSSQEASSSQPGSTLGSGSDGESTPVRSGNSPAAKPASPEQKILDAMDDFEEDPRDAVISMINVGMQNIGADMELFTPSENVRFKNVLGSWNLMTWNNLHSQMSNTTTAKTIVHDIVKFLKEDVYQGIDTNHPGFTMACMFAGYGTYYAGKHVCWGDSSYVRIPTISTAWSFHLFLFIYPYPCIC